MALHRAIPRRSVGGRLGRLINATESDLPRVNQSSRDRRVALEAQWARLKARSDAMMAVDIPAPSRKLWDLGLGVLRKLPLTTSVIP